MPVTLIISLEVNITSGSSIHHNNNILITGVPSSLETSTALPRVLYAHNVLWYKGWAAKSFLTE